MELRNRDSSHRHGVHANAKKEMSNRTGSIKRRYANDRALNNTTADAALDKRPFFRKSFRVQNAAALPSGTPPLHEVELSSLASLAYAGQRRLRRPARPLRPRSW